MTPIAQAPLPRHAPPEEAPIPWRALGVVLVGAFMAVLDTFIVLVAAPAVRTDLHASQADVQLIVAGYQLSYAVALVGGARLGDLYGRRRLFAAGTALFTLASVACAAAPGAGALVAARVVQGLGAAAMFPQVFAVIQVLVPVARRPRVFAVLGAVIGSSTVVGQLLGGALVRADLFGSSWRPVFWVNVPVGVVTLLLAVRWVPESRAPGARGLDLRGAAVLAAALVLLVVPLFEGRQSGWPWWAWLCLAGSLPLFAAFAAVERAVEARGGTPLLRVRLLLRRPFAAGTALVVLTYAGVNSFFLVLSLTLQDGLHRSALGAGLVYTPMALAFFAAGLLAARLARHGRTVLRAGALLGGAGYALTAATAATAATALTGGNAPDAWTLTPGLLLIGAGNGLLVTPLLNAVLALAGPAEAGMASGVLSTGQQVGGALGVAALGAVYYGALGPAAHPTTTATVHAFALAALVDLALSAAVSALLSALPSAPPPAG
ncbi:MFS transporter [Kitasatospora sp. NPDC057198]|uniref:MFS transporter n=1 Tax=Kitasatospora sp. NPDC057198 TaxID=3346046 RepID=UPI0036435F35